MFIILFTTLFVLGSATCGIQNYVNDPEPWGGASCTNNLQCGGANAGVCDLTNGPGTCVCPPHLAKANCSYVRNSVGLPGGLNIGLPFIGLGGIGNIIMGRTGAGAGQLVLTLAIWCFCFVICIALCCCGEAGAVIAYIIYIILGLAFFAGWLWSIIDGAFILECRYPDALGYAMMQ
jgi:hypothetical protein